MKLEENWKVQLSLDLSKEQLSFTLKQLALEELLLEEQHFELAKARLNKNLDS